MIGFVGYYAVTVNQVNGLGKSLVSKEESWVSPLVFLM